MNEDPIGFEGRGGNPYVYVGNEPVNAVDPSGLQDGFIGNPAILGQMWAEEAKLSYVEVLDFHGSSDLNDFSLEYFSKLPRLRSLNVENTRVTSEGVAAFRKQAPGCDIRVTEGLLGAEKAVSGSGGPWTIRPTPIYSATVSRFGSPPAAANQTGNCAGM